MKTSSSIYIKTEKILLFIFISLILLFTIIIPVIGITYRENNIRFSSEKYHTLSDNWTITDESNNRSPISFPYIANYGEHTIKTVIPNDLDIISSPVLVFYSNYTDFSVYLNEQLIYEYPKEENYLKGTGNTYHYIRLSNYLGKNLSVKFCGQLDDTITYVIEAPKIGSKAAFLADAVSNSLFSFLIFSSMMAISIFLFILYIILRKKLNLSYSSLYIAFFTLLFSIYVILESPYIKNIIPNSYLVYICTYIMLGLMPIPLILLFGDAIEKKYKHTSFILVSVCLLNIILQTILHFTNVINYRAMLPCTHVVIIASIFIIAFAILLTDKKEFIRSRIKLLTTIPMVIGIFTDIVLLWIDKPSYNNNFYFVVGVTFFIIFQFSDFLTSYFALHRLAIESKFLRQIAFHDVLSKLQNRNAFEIEIQNINTSNKLDTGCIVIDINRLKHLNDTYGHQMGDKAIVIVGNAILSIAEQLGSCFRTGGDEFVIIIKKTTIKKLEELSNDICSSVELLSSNQLPEKISISIGFGIFKPTDTDILGLLRRVDDLMYENKKIKS